MLNFLGERLRKERRALNITIEDLAHMAGVAPQTISGIEDGIIPRPRDIYAVANILNVNPAWLQFGEPWALKELPIGKR